MKTNYHDYEIVSKNPQVYFWSPTGEIKKVIIIDCDFNKRVTFTYEDGAVDNYKWGYVYNTFEEAILAKHYHEGLYEMDCHQWLEECPDCIDVWKLLLSNKNYAQYKKSKRKEDNNKTSWFVTINDQSYFDSTKFKTLKSALDYFRKLDQDDLEFVQLGEYNSNMYLLTFEDDTLYYEDDKRLGYVLKSRHYGKEPNYKQWRK